MSNRFRNALVVPVIVALFAMAFVVPRAPGQNASAPPAAASDRFAAARAAITQLLKEKSASNVAVAVAKDGKIVWEEGFGFTAHTSGAPAKPDTRFSLASITKALTATGLMILVERGLVDLDKPANEYLGPAKLRAVVEDGPPATVRNLVFHTSGLPMHYHLFYADGAARPPVMDESIRRYGLLAAPPGEAYDYSNFGYGILGHILARVSGQSYAEYMDMAVFQPLGLRRTAILTEAGRLDGAAAKYSAGKRELPFCDFDHQGASAAYASAHDLVRFGMFHLGARAADQKQILSPATLTAMHSRSESSFLDGSRLVKYLLGSFAQIDFMGRQFHTVTGGMPGAVSRLDLLPSEHIASAVLANGDDIALWTLQNAIFNALLSKPLELPAAPSPAPEAAAGARFSPPELLLGRWAGTVRAGDKDLPAALSFRRGGAPILELDGKSYSPLVGQDRSRADGVQGRRLRRPVLGADQYPRHRRPRPCSLYQSQTPREPLDGDDLGCVDRRAPELLPAVRRGPCPGMSAASPDAERRLPHPCKYTLRRSAFPLERRCGPKLAFLRGIFLDQRRGAAMSFISQRAFALLLMPAALSSSSPQDIFDLLRRGDAAAIDATAGIEDRTVPPVLGRELAPGQAMIWYLYHSGWAVKTKNHLLIFDDSEPEGSPARRSLDRGSIDPAEIAGQNVTVIISHVHTDHFDGRILAWRSALKKIRYVWGWEKAGAPEDIHFGTDRRTTTIGGLVISNISFDWDGFPESAFLVKADGLTIFHAGDHGHSRGMNFAPFKDNILYLAKLAPRLDILFTPTFGGETDAIRALKPLVVFPMHDGGREVEYAKFAKRVRALGLDVEVGAADKPGARFFYSKGKLAAF